jgi:hypothetical protein
MINEDIDLLPESTALLEMSDIIFAVQINGLLSLQSSVRAIVTEYRDNFLNDVGAEPALIEPIKLNTQKFGRIRKIEHRIHRNLVWRRRKSAVR